MASQMLIKKIASHLSNLSTALAPSEQFFITHRRSEEKLSTRKNLPNLKVKCLQTILKCSQTVHAEWLPSHHFIAAFKLNFLKFLEVLEFSCVAYIFHEPVCLYFYVYFLNAHRYTHL